MFQRFVKIELDFQKKRLMIFYILLYQYLSLLSNMAAERSKFLEYIDNPYQRITNEITQLQVQDARLHSNVLHLRQRIQSTRKEKTCQSCKIYEDEINMLKSNEKQKISRLQQSIFALQIQNESLGKEIFSLRQAQRERINASQNQIKTFPFENKEKQYTVSQMIAYEQNILKDIEQKAVSLRLKQKRQRDVLRKLKNRRGSIKVTSQLISEIQATPVQGAVIGHKRNNSNNSSGDQYLIQGPNYQVPQLLQNISELIEKISWLEKQNNELMMSLAKKDAQKQSDSIRIINLLSQIQNSKKQLQNMDDFYKNQCAILEQQKQKIVYELNLKFRNQQFQSNNLKMCLQASNREKDKLYYLKQIKESEIIQLKKQITANHQMVITFKAASESNRKYLSDCESRIKQLKQINDVAQNQNIGLRKELQQKLLMVQNLQQKNRILVKQLQIQKQMNINTSIQVEKDSKIHLITQIQKLKTTLSQHVKVLFDKDQQINYFVDQLNRLVANNNELKIASSQRQRNISTLQQNIYDLKNMNKKLRQQKQELSSSLQLGQIKKQRIQSSLVNEIKAKQQFIQKYKLAVQQKNDSYSKINSMQHQLQQSKRIQNAKSLEVQKKNQSIEFLSKTIIELKDEAQSLRKQNYSLKLGQEQSKLQLDVISNDLKQASSKSLGKLKQLQLKQRQLQKLAYFNSQMHKDIQYFNNQNGILISKLKDTEQIISDLEQQNKGNIESLSKYQQQKVLLKQKFKILQGQIRQLNDSLNQSKIISDRQIATLNNSISQLVLEGDKMQHFFTVQSSTFKSQLNQSLEQYNHINKQNQRLQQEINEKDKQSEGLSIINQKLNDRIVFLQTMQKQSQQNKPLKIQQSVLQVISQQDVRTDEQYNLLQQKYEKCIDRIKSIQSEESNYKNNIQYLNERVNNLTKALSQSSQAENQQLLRQLNKKKVMISELLANFSFIEKQLKKKQSEFDDLSNKHEKLIKNTQKDKYDLSQKLSSKETQIALLKKQKEQSNKSAHQRQKQLQKTLHKLQQDIKVKDKLLAQQRKEKEKQKIRLAEQKRKVQTSSSKQINILRESLESEKRKSQKSSLNSSPAKFQDQKKKEIDQLKKIINENLIKIRSLQKKIKQAEQQKEQFHQSLKHAQIQIKQLTQHLAEVSVNFDVHNKQMHQLTILNEKLQKSLRLSQQNNKIHLRKNEALESTLSLKQKQLLDFAHKYKKLVAKCQKLTTQSTEKDLSYDCLWIQLDRSKSTIASLSKQITEKKQLRIAKTLSQQISFQAPIEANDIQNSYKKQELKESNVNIVIEQLPMKESELNEILDVMDEQQEILGSQTQPFESKLIKKSQSEIIEEKKQVANSVKQQEVFNEQQVAQISKKSSSKNIILEGHRDLSQAISEAEKNDQFNEFQDQMSHQSSNVQRNLQYISDYSRVKSTKSNLTNKEVQDQYNSKMKNSKIMAKFRSTRKK